MSHHRQVSLEYRKYPVQVRSVASVNAILEATVQVLISTGKERLTTARVARRAGVSVGTLYQYFPNKSALLQGALERHLDEVAMAAERVCQKQKGSTLQVMASELMTAYMNAKMRDPRASVALCRAASEVDEATVLKRVGIRIKEAIIAMLATASEPLSADPELVATMLQGAMIGVSRKLLQSDSPEEQFPSFLEELIFFVSTYLKACSMGRTA